ncbi:MAG: hypothetical protein FWD31_05030 [Planctomycetaceae bacterium]|nr:hypothetical protein [Planctomycetaceae bacterium]
MPTRYFVHVLFFACVLTALAGCTKSPYDLVKVTGTVTLDGQPTEAVVNFFPIDNQQRGAIGQAGSNGKFVLGTLQGNDGAVAGKHRVAISSKTPPPMSGSAQMLGGESQPYVSPFPEKYGHPTTSGFEVEVKKGEKNDFTFDLKSS